MTAADSSPRPKTPWHLWVVGLLSLLWNAVGALDYTMTELRNEAYLSKFTPEQLEYFYSFPSWVIACWAIAVWGGLLGSILLLLRKGLATWTFLISFLAMVATTVHNYVLDDGWKIMGGIGVLIFAAAIFIIALALYLYARAMAKKGVLA